MSQRLDLEAAYLWATELDVLAPKPGNVSVGAPAHGMTADEFRASAAVTAPIVADVGIPLGRAVRLAAEATLARVGCNTNLGILLLCVPLARAAAAAADAGAALDALVRATGPTDSEDVFAAIRTLAPGGLGRSDRHDVHAPANAGLFEVMGEARERDSIARQYVTGFADVLAFARRARGMLAVAGPHPAPGLLRGVVDLYLQILAAIPDSHVARKFGPEAARRLQADARLCLRSVRNASSEDEVRTIHRELDDRLGSLRINPGTSADLTVAALFAARALFGGGPGSGRGRTE